MDEKEVEQILKICELIVSNNIISENTPPSIASGCIYYFIKKKEKNITKKQISTICKISEVTINKCCKVIEGEDKLFNEVFNESIS